MRSFFLFIASTTGRMLRVIAGLVLLFVALFLTEGAVSWIIGIIAFIPLLAGAFDLCLLAPMAGLPFKGSRLRKALQ